MKTIVSAIFECVLCLHARLKNDELVFFYHSVVKELVNIFHISSGQKDETRKIKLDEKHRVISIDIMKAFQSIPGTLIFYSKNFHQ